MAFSLSKQQFIDYFEMALLRMDYCPHKDFSVFTQFDKEYYLSYKEEFLFKYKCFAALGYVLRPKHLIELGVCAGSGAHAYLSGSKNTFYTGYDIFNPVQTANGLWNGLDIAQKVLQELNIKHILHQINLREIKILPQADLVVVDADHSYYHAFEDCILAQTANPQYIFIDDYAGEDVKKVVEDLLTKYISAEWTHEIKYNTRGFLIKIKSD